MNLRPIRPRARMLATLVVLAGAWSSAPARALDLAPLRPDAAPYFLADPVISLDGDGKPTMTVSVSVPFYEVQWVKVGPADRRAARVEFTVVFDPGRGRRQFGDTWERRVVVPTAAASRSPNSRVADRRSFPIPAGRYELRVEVRDLNSGLGSNTQTKIEVPDYSRVPVGFADLELGTVDSAKTFTAEPGRVFGVTVSSMAARATLFDRRAGDWPRKYPFRYRILDDLGEEVVNGALEVSLGHSAEPVLLRPARSDLFIGDYVFVVELVEGSSRWRVERSFTVEQSGPPRGREFETMLEPLAFIATSAEIEALKALAPDRQADGWNEFWRRRDPTPETPRNESLLEFVRRVRYSERHFQGFGPGWRSDMGRIYIQNGPPDQIENRPATSQSSQLELWYYTNPYRRFVFADRDGFGRFQLLNTVGS
ncbi:MAG: GWxTD domain-containing protein [Candidatus Eisenbacteria bacterium]|uniref:GWxTD domain-containing protein n=1 Tax=Eiseniibacteriota bacterium TaxID=2212470 RepID=A0A849SB02_UNCEI|nr:GWxTD domain-containing protein [Candidatus Eisenbacteria bacterium]